jgi:hypothetical protein
MTEILQFLHEFHDIVLVDLPSGIVMVLAIILAMNIFLFHE